MKLAPSILYKEQGVSHDTPGVSPTTPLEIATKVGGKLGPSLFGRTSLVAVVDVRVPDKAYRIYGLLAAVCWDLPVQLAYEEIAFAVDSSRPQVIRHVKALEGCGYVAVKRTRNRRNEYSVPGVTGVRIPTPKAAPARAEVARMPRAKKQQRDTSVRGMAAHWARIQDERRKELA